MRYIPATETDVEQMLAACQRESVDDLFRSIPEAVRLAGPLELPTSLDEGSLLRHLADLAGRNQPAAAGRSFLGGGFYHHHIPQAVNQLLLRSEFYTAYTPYQPEIAQGTLQAMFEFQTLICQLTGMEIANASLYEGGSALSEALFMAERALRRRRDFVVAANIHPDYRRVAETHLQFRNRSQLSEAPIDATGRVDREALKALIGPTTAAVAVGYPGFHGVVEDIRDIAELVHEAGALLVVVLTDPVGLALMTPPGELGADIVIGEGQGLGVPMSFGGPALGLLATRKKYLRSIPGRLVGQTVDAAGERGFVLTLSTREQHIRRERATSNICTNQGLMALSATMTMAMLGQSGLRQMARTSHIHARYLLERLLAVPGVTAPAGEAPLFNEFVIELPRDAAPVVQALKARGWLPGIPLSRWPAAALGGAERAGRQLLLAVTEQNSRSEMDGFATALAAVLAGSEER